MSILDVFDNFYEVVEPAKENIPEIGHLWFTPVPFVEEVPKIFQALRADPQEHQISDFEIVEINSNHFTNRTRLPIKKLNLELTEELIINKAKKRPVIVLAKSKVGDVDTIKDPTHKRLAKQLERNRFLVAPLYSVSKMTTPSTFGPELVKRIGEMRYQHLFLLPEMEAGKGDSIIRLDGAFNCYLGRCSIPLKKSIHSVPLAILRDQFSSMVTGRFTDELMETIVLARI